MATNPFSTAGNVRIGRIWPALLVAALLAATGARAQGVPATAAPTPFSAAELQTLVGPIALYVDDLLGIVLPASAYPLQVVQAARFLDAREQDPSLRPDDAWDDSVIALLNYPEVLRMMDANLDWTANLGEAFVYQQMDLLEAIQQFRALTRSAGNLQSDNYQTVSDNGGAIAIAPANPQVIYVPYYEPARVVTYYPVPVVRYYPYGYPVYNYPYASGHSFSSGFFWGVTTAFILNWHTHYVYVYPRHYAQHPYHGHRYYDRYYVRHYEPRRYVTRDHHDHTWRPDHRRHSYPDRHSGRQDRYVRADRNDVAPDRHRSALAAPVTSSPSSSTRPAWQDRRQEEPRSPVTDRDGRASVRSYDRRTPPAEVAQRTQGTSTRNIQRVPVSPPRTAATNPAPQVTRTTPPPAGHAASQHRDERPSPRAVGTPTRPGFPVVRTPPARTVPAPVAVPRMPNPAPDRARAERASRDVAPPRVNPRATARPPQAPAASANDSPRQANTRPPQAAGPVAPAPAREARRQEAPQQDARGKSGRRTQDKR